MANTKRCKVGHTRRLSLGRRHKLSHTTRKGMQRRTKNARIRQNNTRRVLVRGGASSYALTPVQQHTIDDNELSTLFDEEDHELHKQLQGAPEAPQTANAISAKKCAAKKRDAERRAAERRAAERRAAERRANKNLAMARQRVETKSMTLNIQQRHVNQIIDSVPESCKPVFTGSVQSYREHSIYDTPGLYGTIHKIHYLNPEYYYEPLNTECNGILVIQPKQRPTGFTPGQSEWGAHVEDQKTEHRRFKQTQQAQTGPGKHSVGYF